MKKLLILLLVVLTLTGCEEKEKEENVKLDLGAIQEKLTEIAYSVDDESKNVDLIFKENIIVNADYMTGVYNVDFSNVEEFAISVPSTDERAEMYAIVLPKEGKEDAVKDEMDKFIKAYQNEWNGTDQKNMVKNVLTQSYGDYLIYIISNKSEAVYSTITGN